MYSREIKRTLAVFQRHLVAFALRQIGGNNEVFAYFHHLLAKSRSVNGNLDRYVFAVVNFRSASASLGVVALGFCVEYGSNKRAFAIDFFVSFVRYGNLGVSRSSTVIIAFGNAYFKVVRTDVERLSCKFGICKLFLVGTVDGGCKFKLQRTFVRGNSVCRNDISALVGDVRHAADCCGQFVGDCFVADDCFTASALLFRPNTILAVCGSFVLGFSVAFNGGKRLVIYGNFCVGFGSLVVFRLGNACFDVICTYHQSSRILTVSKVLFLGAVGGFCQAIRHFTVQRRSVECRHLVAASRGKVI